MAVKKEEKNEFILLNDAENEIAGSFVPSKIRGLIFDFGSTLFYATEKKTKIEMNNAMKETLSKYFKWSSNEINLFWSHYIDISKECCTA